MAMRSPSSSCGNDARSCGLNLYRNGTSGEFPKYQVSPPKNQFRDAGEYAQRVPGVQRALLVDGGQQRDAAQAELADRVVEYLDRQP